MHDRGVSELRMVVDGTLQFMDHRGVWACLAGDFDGRRLYLRVEGRNETRPFSWAEFGGVARTRSDALETSAAGLEALRAWVAAEAVVLLSSEQRAR